MGSHSLLQEIFPTQGIEPRSPTLQANSLPTGPPLDIKEMISRCLDSCIFHRQKSTKFINWKCLVLFNSNLWCFDYLVFAAKTPIHPGSSLSSSEPSLSYLRVCLPGFQIKCNSQLFGCAFFFSQQFPSENQEDGFHQAP